MLTREDRKIWIVLLSVFAACVIAVIVLSTAQGEDSGIPSSYSVGSKGAKAGFMLLEDLGFKVEHWHGSPGALQPNYPDNTVLVLADPQRVPSTEERDWIIKFIRRGGRLLAAGPNVSFFFPDRDQRFLIPHFAWKTYKPLLPSELTHNVNEIVMAPKFYFNPHSRLSTIHFADGEQATVASFTIGKGEVIWWSSSDPLTNRGITQKDNLALFLNSVGPSRNGPVLWDEFFHEDSASFVDTVFAGPTRWGLVQLGIVGLFAVFTYSRRFGPLRETTQPPRLAPIEFVHTLASLYARARARNLAVEVNYQRFRALLMRKLGVRLDAPLSAVAETVAARLGSESAPVQAFLERCEGAISNPDATAGEALDIVRTLDEYVQAMNLTSSAERKTK